MDALITLFFTCIVAALLGLPILVGASVRDMASRKKPSRPPVDDIKAKTVREIWLEHIRWRKADRLGRREKLNREIDETVRQAMRKR